MPKVNVINEQQREFCRLYVSGKSTRDSVLTAYPRMSQKAALSHGARLLKKAYITQEIDRLRELIDKPELASFEHKRGVLLSIINDSKNPPMTRVKAIEADNKMMGHFSADKIELTGSSGGAIELVNRTSEQMLSFAEMLAKAKNKIERL